MKYNISFKISLKVFLLLLLEVFFLSSGLSSCKSHKKNKVEEPVYVGEQIEVKKKKKEKKKDKTVGEKIAEECITWIGTPYGYGRSDKGVATDCSGLVISVYRDVAGIKLPRNSAEQANYCDDLKEKDVLPGDLVFFATGKDKKKVSHVKYGSPFMNDMKTFC